MKADRRRLGSQQVLAAPRPRGITSALAWRHLEGSMFRAQRGYQRFVAVGVACSLLLLSAALGDAQTATNGVNVTQPVGNEWPGVGGHLRHGLCSALNQINTGNVKDLKAAWMIHLGSGLATGTPATPPY